MPVLYLFSRRSNVQDTIVRYSSAKYLARLTAILPTDYADQIVPATIALFQGTEDEPVVETPHGTILDPGGSNSGGTMGFGGGETTKGEARWHGVCLALAEMARRGLVKDDAVGEAVKWVLKVCVLYTARFGALYDLMCRLSLSISAEQPTR